MRCTATFPVVRNDPVSVGGGEAIRKDERVGDSMLDADPNPCGCEDM